MLSTIYPGMKEIDRDSVNSIAVRTCIMRKEKCAANVLPIFYMRVKTYEGVSKKEKELEGKTY